MPRIMILTPLENSCFDEQKQKKITENAVKMKEVLGSMKYSEDIIFEDFLNKLQLTVESYIIQL